MGATRRRLFQGSVTKTMIISLIVAMDRNGVIGSQGGMPWRLPADLRYFKKVTMGKPVVMGRKTFKSIGKPLPGRHNIVLTRSHSFAAPGCTVVHSPAAALTAAGNAEEVMIIGGAEIYRQFLPCSDRIYLTRIDAAFEGDTVFPELRAREWRATWEEAHKADEHHPYSFRWLILERAPETENLPKEQDGKKA